MSSEEHSEKPLGIGDEKLVRGKQARSYVLAAQHPST